MARQNILKADYARRQAEKAGLHVAFDGPIFNEFAVRLNLPVKEANRRLLQDGIIGGYDLGLAYPELNQHMLIAVTELRTKEEIDSLIAGLGINMNNQDQALIFEMSREGRVGYSLPELDVPETELESLLPGDYIRDEDAKLPEVSELDIMRHYTALSKRNHGVDSGFYPLGSCTMKYNPKLNEKIARFAGFSAIHPLQDEDTVQGRLSFYTI